MKAKVIRQKKLSIKNGDALRNINSYEYLSHFREALSQITNPMPEAFIQVLQAGQKVFDPLFAYGDLLTAFLLEIEQQIEANTSLSQLICFDQIVTQVFHNENQALERCYGFIKPVLRKSAQTAHAMEDKVRQLFIGQDFWAQCNYWFHFNNVNKMTPEEDGSRAGRLSLEVATTAKPQLGTCQYSVRRFDYKEDDLPVELRLGTQGQLVGTGARVNPVFKRFLEQKPRTDKPIAHVYFNLLPATPRKNWTSWFRENLGIGKSEAHISNALMALEDDVDNVAVITLPATKGVMNWKAFQDYKPAIAYQTAFNDLLQAGLCQVVDFHISDKIKGLIYEGQDGEQEAVKKLLKESFAYFGFSKQEKLSPADKQAVFFHFSRYVLPHFIFAKLEPESFNFTCWDGADRAGICSAYFNLVQSIERGNPLSQDEFEKTIHAAPALTKGRSINSQVQILWSVVNTFVNNKRDKAPEWLISWRNDNALPKTPLYGLKKLKQYEDMISREAASACFLSCFQDKELKRSKKAAAKALIQRIEQSSADFPLAIDCSKTQLRLLLDGRLNQALKNLFQCGTLSSLKCNGKNYFYDAHSDSFKVRKPKSTAQMFKPEPVPVYQPSSQMNSPTIPIWGMPFWR